MGPQGSDQNTGTHNLPGQYTYLACLKACMQHKDATACEYDSYYDACTYHTMEVWGGKASSNRFCWVKQPGTAQMEHHHLSTSTA